MMAGRWYYICIVGRRIYIDGKRTSRLFITHDYSGDGIMMMWVKPSAPWRRAGYWLIDAAAWLWWAFWR